MSKDSVELADMEFHLSSIKFTENQFMYQHLVDLTKKLYIFYVTPKAPPSHSSVRYELQSTNSVLGLLKN